MTDFRRHPRDGVHRTAARHIAQKIRGVPVSADTPGLPGEEEMRSQMILSCLHLSQHLSRSHMESVSTDCLDDFQGTIPTFAFRSSLSS